MQIIGNTLIFSTGRRADANNGIVGISEGYGRLWITEGYDGPLDDDIDDDGDLSPWTPAERQELAEYMIALWTRYRDETPA